MMTNHLYFPLLQKARWNRLLKQKQEEKSEQDRAKKQMAPTFLK